MPQPTRARWIAAALCVLYAFAKLNGSQFAPLDSEISRPMRDVSGYWLTWYYFSYSPAYGTLIALVQLGCGILLTFRRTALLAAVMLMPMFVNILLIDIFFRIAFGATMVALLILTCLAAVIAPQAGRLREVFLPETAPYPLAPRIAMVAAIVVAAWSGTWLGVRYFKKQPTAIDGTWRVIAQSGATDNVRRWQQVFFERNRAYLVVFRSAEGDVPHHFEVDASGVVRVWETLHAKGALILQGRTLPDDRMQLDEVAGRAGRLVLQRERPPQG